MKSWTHATRKTEKREREILVKNMCNKKNYVLQNQNKIFVLFHVHEKFREKNTKTVFLLSAPPRNNPPPPSPARQCSNFRENEIFIKFIFCLTSSTEVSSDYWCHFSLTSDGMINVENKPATRQTSRERRRRIMRAATVEFSSRSNLIRWKLRRWKISHKIDTSFQVACRNLTKREENKQALQGWFSCNFSLSLFSSVREGKKLCGEILSRKVVLGLIHDSRALV